MMDCKYTVLIVEEVKEDGEEWNKLDGNTKKAIIATRLPLTLMKFTVGTEFPGRIEPIMKNPH